MKTTTKKVRMNGPRKEEKTSLSIFFIEKTNVMQKGGRKIGNKIL